MLDCLIIGVVGKVAVGVVDYSAKLLDCVPDFHKLEVVAVVERRLQERGGAFVAVLTEKPCDKRHVFLCRKQLFHELESPVVAVGFH